MSKFHYDTDDLGYEIENLGANHRLFPPENSSLHSFTEPDLKKGVCSCDEESGKGVSLDEVVKKWMTY